MMEHDWKEIGKRLLVWYRKNKRDLPWRRTKDPYKIWISEIMLQQTRVEAVKEYYKRFVEAFPDVHALANASEEQVLTLWQGLGYYSRARNLMKTAQIIASIHGGNFPMRATELKTLPGIGDYTSGAIASIAFEEPVPAVDGNVLRVIARLSAIEEDILTDEVKRKVTALVTQMIPVDAPGDFTQSLMELGAMVCTPKSPKCQTCPLQEVCIANEREVQNILPLRGINRKKEKPTLYWQVAYVQKNEHVLMEYREKETLLGRMWGFPMVQVEDKESLDTAWQEKYGIQMQFVKELGEAVHEFTHRLWRMQVSLYELIEETEITHSNLQWIPFKEFSQYAIPTAFQKVIQRNF